MPNRYLSNDHAITVADILTGRALVSSGHVLWVSGAPRPDLGGAEEDDNVNGNVFFIHLCFSLFVCLFVVCLFPVLSFRAYLYHYLCCLCLRFLFFSHMSATDEETVNPEISVAGSYRTVCTQLDLNGLAVAAVLLSHRVNELEGALGMMRVLQLLFVFNCLCVWWHYLSPLSARVCAADPCVCVCVCAGVIDAAAAAAAAAAPGPPSLITNATEQQQQHNMGDAAAAAAAAGAGGGGGGAHQAPMPPAGSIVTGDESLSVVPAFKVVKQLVTKWYPFYSFLVSLSLSLTLVGS